MTDLNLPLDNLYFDPAVLFSASAGEQVEIAPKQSLILQPEQVTLELFNQLSPLQQYVDQGFRMLPESFLGINKEMVANGFSVNRVVARFTPDGRVMGGTTSLYQAGYKDESKVTHPKDHPFGEPGKRTQFIGNGFLAEIHLTDNGWEFNHDTAVVSHHYSYENLVVKARWAAEDIVAGVKRGLPFQYVVSDDLRDSITKVLAGKALHPDVLRGLVKMAAYGEMRLLNQFTYSYDDFGLSYEQHTQVGQAAKIHDQIRANVSKRMTIIAANSGVAAGAYAEFLVFSFPNAFGFNPPKDGYPDPFINMSHYWNDETHLPGGLLIMARPVPISTGRAHRPLPFTGRKSRYFGVTRPVVPSALPSFSEVEKAAWKVGTVPSSPIATDIDSIAPDANMAFTDVSEDEYI